MNYSPQARDRKSLTELDYPTADPATGALLELARQAAQTPATVLLLGESGTGKSMLARAIHKASPFRDKAFVTVSCPSLSEQLLESELFGHRKGAFTGAIRDHWGKVAAAQGGTLFLDEVGDLPVTIQPKLLRLLQEREYERVGDTRVHHAEVRIIAATNQDLKKRMTEKKFREDLYYRLNVVALDLPPLRERPEDLERAARKLLDKTRSELGRPAMEFSPAAWDALRNHSWPGNFRELENVVQRGVLTCRKGAIEPLHLQLREQEQTSHVLPRVGSRTSLEDLEASHIREVVRKAGTLQQAASILDIDNSTLFRKRRKYAI
jgi:NtrC-family two-component system response regulator AlgB